MRLADWFSALALAALVALPVSVMAVGEPEQFFASITLDKKKIGTFHVRISRDDNGEIEEVRARASVSVLGIKLYEFTQDLTHNWKGGEFEGMHGTADNNGKTYDVSLERTDKGLEGTLNGKPVSLPADAFPNSLWHYGVIDHSPLFDEITLDILSTTVKTSDDEIEFGGKNIDTTKSVFSGDLTATVWFDKDRSFIKGTMTLEGRTVIVERDADS